ncbi:uncharacterized protein AMSG_11934 [Thecamonas trahens ATCC 50062]|uniref:Fe2OG dioxygenase domain-containing protein n=1 Tax=Thecamonas trahens ATCC 50062 TaxID=461836 RepID=A0A0L0DEL1_THETB|nr:hypothetical protein AMSG_11934 [Thecamonas trahens ATCC 50062]KNC49768.1 hypothetical protein AMSG_11934 [Thecamonas trahens ATCC 50062]|eukprot:XP_013757614.1 hypothetical protein AMSG_11934 [Thecamonas trahens ATCC 50062]
MTFRYTVPLFLDLILPLFIMSSIATSAPRSSSSSAASSASSASTSPAKSYNQRKVHNGKLYSGMRVGSTHRWNYSDAALEVSEMKAPAGDSSLGVLTPMQSQLAYEAVKSRLNAAPIGSGAAVNTIYHWFLVTELAFGDASDDGKVTSATLRGPKFKLAHKRPHWRKFSAEYSGNTPVPRKRIECLESLLGDAPPREAVTSAAKAAALPSYQASELLDGVAALKLGTCDTSWIETKVGPDEWEVAVNYGLTAAPRALAGARFLVVADQFATKLNANQYATQLAGAMYYLGDGSLATPAANALKIKIVSALTSALKSELPALKPAQPSPPPPKPLTAFWQAVGTPMPVMPPPKKVSRKRPREPEEKLVHPDVAVGPIVRPAELTKRAKTTSAGADADILARLKHELSPSAGILYAPGAVPADQADALFDAMATTVPWGAKRWRGSVLPRLVWHYQEGVVPALDMLLCSISSAFGVSAIKGAFCNLYRNGEDHTPYHADEYGADVLSISLGATRKFHFKPKGVTGAAATARRITYDLAHGDVLIFDESVNARYLHTVPKMKAVTAARINVTVFAVRDAPPPPPPALAHPSALEPTRPRSPPPPFVDDDALAAAAAAATSPLPTHETNMTANPALSDHPAAAPANNTTLGQPGFVSGYGSAHGNATGPVVGSYVAPSGPATVQVQEAEAFENVVVRVPRAEATIVRRGPPSVRTQVVPGPTFVKVVPEYVAGPVRTIKEVIPGPVTYRDEKVEVPGPVRERIERVEVPGPVVERVVHDYVPGAVVEKEVKVEIPGPVTYKDVKVQVPGPVIRRPVPKQVQVPGPVRVVKQRVPVPQPHIREVTVKRKVAVPKPVNVEIPGPTREILVHKRDNLLEAENARLRAEIAFLQSIPSAPHFEVLARREIKQQQQQFGGYPQQFGGYPQQQTYGSAYPGYGF